MAIHRHGLSLILGLCSLWWTQAQAQVPSGGVVQSGSAVIGTVPQGLTITQASAGAVIDWQSFNIGAGQGVDIRQPGASSVLLNRVVGSAPSEIFGRLTANGRVFLLNPNGVLFGPGTQVDVGALVASTLSISNQDFTTGRYAFAGDSAASVVNQGAITARAGDVYLFARTVENTGTLRAPAGTVGLAAGQEVLLSETGNEHLAVRLAPGESAATAAVLTNSGAIAATQVELKAAGGNPYALAVNNSGIVRATGLRAEGGRIFLEAGEGRSALHTGVLDASGRNGQIGGEVQVRAAQILQAGTIEASGGRGGTITLQATDSLQQTAAGVIRADGALGAGGQITATAGSTGSQYLSGALSTNGITGGTIQLLGRDLRLGGTQVTATGWRQGGRILVGGDYQGSNPVVLNARTLAVSPGTAFDASATEYGAGGRVILWSDERTAFGGDIWARGGRQGGNGGLVETSSKGELIFGGNADVGAPLGRAGAVLLDPKNIIVANSSAINGLQIWNLEDPNPAAGDNYGLEGTIFQLPNGNIVVGSPNDDFGGPGAGAVFLFSGATRMLISSLVGSAAGDRVGYQILDLGNGNFLVSNQFWNNGAVVSAGAVTWGNGTTGLTGIVSAANSLVGTSALDRVGYDGVTTLSNGNYIVRSPFWDNGTVVDAGAVTWGNGATGTVGVVSAANSVVGTTANDLVGYDGVTTLGNGNYVVRSPLWDNGTVVDAGAVTWGNGATGTVGTVSAVNSLVGTNINDVVGDGGVTTLSNGNYVVRSSYWANGSAAGAGAVTWGNGATGTVGVVSAANSLVGTTFFDVVGGGGVTALSNGNYVVRSDYWDNGTAVDAGAVTWGNGATGTVGVVSAANSLVGTTAFDRVGGSGVTVLSNGNYVVRSPNWGSGVASNAGAVTWGNGATGTVGVVSAANSLVGSSTNDQVGIGGVTALNNGNYVVRNDYWNNGAVVRAGAVTWGNGATGTVGVVSAANSLVGTAGYDQVGIGGVTTLSNGNYVVRSPIWANGSAAGAGAVTWGNGATGTVGAVSAVNSLIGSTSNDRVGSFGVTTLSNGNYVALIPDWDNDTAVDAGAVTWGNGATGTVGVVSAANSLVGTTTNDLVGTFGLITLNNGNYVVRNPDWDNDTAVDAGAVTWGNGATGTVGVVSAANSLVGTTIFDRVGIFGVTTLSNGNYVVRSSTWDNGTAVDAGAVTWGNGATGTVGVVSAANSLIGANTADNLGSNYGDLQGNIGVTALSNGNYVVRSPNWANGTAANAGAVTWGNGATGTVGVVSAANSLVGTTAFDRVGYGGVTALSNGNYVVRSSVWDNGATVNAGAVTWGNGATGTVGVVSAANSLVGTTANDQVGYGVVTPLSNGNYVVSSPYWSSGSVINVGAVTWGNGATGITGPVSPANSFVGTTAGDQVGSGGVLGLSNGSFIVRSPLYDNGAVDTGLVSYVAPFDPATGQLYANQSSATVTISPYQITTILNTGAALVLQANNDITINGAILANNPGGNGGDLTLQAGRSLLVNANITTDNGALTLIANDNLANGVVDAQRDPGAAVIALAGGTAIDAGTGAVTLDLRPGTGKTNATAGAITLGTSGSPATLTAGTLDVAGVDNVTAYGALTATGNVTLAAGRNLQLAAVTAGGSLSARTTNGDITLLGGTLSAGASGPNALRLDAGAGTPAGTVTGGNFINNAGASALSVPNGNWQIFTGGIASTVASGLAFTQRYNTDDNYVPGVAGNYLFYREAPALTLTADLVSRVYGTVNPAFSGSITGFVNGDTIAAVGGATYDSTATAASGVGSYAITGTVATNPYNYTITQAAGNATALAITPATLVYTADAATRVYGSANPAFTGAVSGFVNGDTLASATSGTLGFASPATVASGVGNYAINGSGLTAANYVFTQAAGNATALTVTPATLVYTADAATRVYGSANPAFTGAVSGFVNGDTLAGATTGTLGFNSPATAASGVGNHAINGGGLTAANYVFAQAAGNAAALTITAATLVYTADTVARIYGSANPPFSGAVSGFVNGDTLAGATSGTLGFTSPATASSGVGNYTINGGGLTAANYVFTQAAGNAGALTITPATLVYTADAVMRLYGTANPTFSGAVSGFVNGDTLGSATTGTLNFTSPATAASGVGGYAINGGGLTAANYVFTQAAGNATALTIAPARAYAANLTYTLNATGRTHDLANPIFQRSLAGFTSGKNVADADSPSLIAVSPTVAVPADLASPDTPTARRHDDELYVSEPQSPSQGQAPIIIRDGGLSLPTSRRQTEPGEVL